MPEAAGGDTVQDLIRAEAKKQGIPAALALAVAEQESGFNPTLTNPKKVGDAQENAIGVFQLLPSTAKRLGVDPADYRQNIAGGVKYLKELKDQHGGDLNKVLATYGGVVNDQTYVPQVTKRFERYLSLEGAGATAAASQAARTGKAGPTAPGAPAVATPPPAGAVMPGAAPSLVTDAPGQKPGASTQPASTWDVEKMYLQDFFGALDPRSPEGRRNIVSMGAEAGATALAGPKIGTMARTALAAGSSALAGGLETAAENVAGTSQESPLTEGALQGAYSIGGHTFAWPIRRVGGWLTGGTVARDAKAFVTENAAKVAEQGKAAVAAARQQARESLESARILADNTIESIKAQGAAAIEALGPKSAAQKAASTGSRQAAARVNQAASTMLADAELRNTQALSAIKGTYNELVASSPSAADAALKAREVFTGPTKIALDKAGQLVAEAAADGPDVAFAPIQAAVRKMQQVSPTQVVEEALAGAASKNTGLMATVAARKPGAEAAATMATPTRLTADEFKMWVADQAAKVESGGEIDALPTMLGKIRDAEVSELPYATMHSLKRVLDAGVNWDRAAKAINEQLTKGTRIAVRDAMSGFAPYDAATAAYQSLVNIYRKGVGRTLGRNFLSNPDAAAKILNPSKPIAARQLRSLLVDQAAAGGDAIGGQQAWDAARASFVHQNVLSGGIDQLETKLTKLQHATDFYQTVFGDQSGQQVLHNLWSITHAYNDVLAANAERTAAARGAARAARGAASTLVKEDVAAGGEKHASAVAAERTATASKVAREKSAARSVKSDLTARGNEAIGEAKAAAAAGNEDAKALQQSFADSSLTPPPDAITSVLGDVAHVVTGHVPTRGKVMALKRLLNGPKSADLLQWMAHSDKWTQRLVKLSQSPYNDQLMGLFVRDLAAEAFAPAVTATGTSPAPATSTTGTASPGKP